MLTPRQTSAMRHICAIQQTIGTLATALGVTASVACRHVDDLVHLRLVRRKPNPDDARSVLVLPTVAGRRVVEGRK
jgi:DNA-binding MarR family transcriptional regulator